MTYKITPSTIGDIRTRINWIKTEAIVANYYAGILGRPNEDDEISIHRIYTSLENILEAAKKAKKFILSEQKKYGGKE